MIDAAEILQMHEEREIPYDPAQDGFVFSTSEIHTFIQRRDSRNRYLSALYLISSASMGSTDDARRVGTNAAKPDIRTRSKSHPAKRQGIVKRAAFGPFSQNAA